MATTTAPYGTWGSPITAADAVAGIIGFAEVLFDRGDLYWVEMRPSEGGRQVLVGRDAAGAIDDLTPAPINVRTRVHEYGGGAVTVGGGRVVFSDFADQRLYRVADGDIEPVTPEPPRPGSVRFADGRMVTDASLVCVRETHPEEGGAVNEVVLVDLEDGAQTILATGRDFYAAPRPSSDGRLAWLEWDHPNMPWDGTELMVGVLEGGDLGSRRRVAGGPEESVFQPEWAPDGNLVFASDGTGWWNLYRWDGATVSELHAMDADFGHPLWVFGRTTFGFLSEGRLLAGYWSEGTHRLAIVGPDGSFQGLSDPEHTSHERLLTDGESRAWFVGSGPAAPTRLVELDVDTGESTVVRSNPMPVDEWYIPKPRTISFPTGDGETAHAIFYPPTNPAFSAPEGELPPLIVEVHGGPTGQVFPRLAITFLYWTSRGFAVVDVNYRGSSGYGRDYRNRLRHSWGIVDVEDCLAAARYLAEQGEVDGKRMVITGGSAGGYTTLASLAFGDAFSAGASYYGVADLALLAEHTHKFESRYLDGLVGTDPALMRERSPLHSADRIDVPVILFQGLEDRVVPPEQAEMIAAALESRGVPHALITYEGEDHGFRDANNIVHSLESELGFFGKVLGFVPAGDIPDVPLVGG
jgi:dipeptidyl aminopeptidase/acylaminoacyl peptidase